MDTIEFFGKLEKTRSKFIGKLRKALPGRSIDSEIWDEIEEALLTSDLGPTLTYDLILRTKEIITTEKIQAAEDILDILKNEMVIILSKKQFIEQSYDDLEINLIVGVNGSGKTTTIAKLAKIKKELGKSVLIVAGDTFRAAAISQIKYWGNHLNIDVIANDMNSDPASVIYDGIKAAKARRVDCLIIDTAGRLHNETNLMNELKKINSVINREAPTSNVESHLIIDANTGQNGLAQAEEFVKKIDITSIIVTKIDGSAKGGVIIAIKDKLDIPISYLGVGETEDDLVKFNAHEFVDGIMGNT
jgi:fused signal recognition particle receptor